MGNLIFFLFDNWHIIFVSLTLFISLIVNQATSLVFKKYSLVPNKFEITGYDVALELLTSAHIKGVKIIQSKGRSSGYDTKERILSLSGDVYNGSSITAIGIAAHEAGHAIQDYKGYPLLELRYLIIPFSNIGSQAGTILAFLGLIFSQQVMIIMGLAMFILAALFQIATLPVEFNASRRALRLMSKIELFDPSEYERVNRILTFSALIYFSSLTSIISGLLRIILSANITRDQTL